MSAVLSVEDFAQWLRDEEFSAKTQEDATRAARRVFALVAAGEPLPSWLAKHARRMLGAAEALGAAWPRPITRALRDLVEQAQAERKARTPRQVRAARRKARERQEPPYADEDWRALYEAALQDEAPAAAVLVVMMATGLRIGDVLRIERKQLDEGARTGLLRLRQKGGGERGLRWEGASEAWERLLDVWEHYDPEAPTVAHLVAPEGDGSPLAGHGAYRKVQRTLKRLAGDELGLPGRPHLHRLRRTVIVQALVATGDVELARDVAGHASIATTARYVAHTRPEVVAKVQRQLAARRKGTSDE